MTRPTHLNQVNNQRAHNHFQDPYYNYASQTVYPSNTSLLNTLNMNNNDLQPFTEEQLGNRREGIP